MTESRAVPETWDAGPARAIAEPPSSAGIKVSVVVPVYNPGPYLQRCVESLLAQSLSPEAFEAVLVDDGSTDGSGEALDALAARHPNVHVIHQENSGWPGKPRNVGIDAARGEYIFFADADDALGPEALERLHAMATRNRSDIVVARLVGVGRHAPRGVFLRNRERATLADTPLMSTLTAHKLFRREFLVANAIRFPEGRRRLEDQVFVVRAYFAARIISVLADYTCYYHYALDDRRSAATGQFDPGGHVEPADYYASVREVLAIVEANTEPGALRDRLLKRFARGALVARFAAPGFINAGRDHQQALLDEVRAVAAEHIPPTVDVLLTPPHRAQMALLRSDRDDALDLHLQLGRAERDIDTRATVIGPITRRRGRLRIVAEVELVDGSGPIAFRTGGDGYLLPVPDTVATAIPERERSFRGSSKGSTVLVARRRDDATEVVLPAVVRGRVVEGAQGVRLLHRLTLDLDREALALGGDTRPGEWELVVRTGIAGYAREAFLEPGSEPEGWSEVVAGPRSPVAVRFTGPGGHLALDVGAPGAAPAGGRPRRWIDRLLGR